MELVELVENLELLVLTNCSLYMRGDHAAIFRDLNLVKPVDELAKLGDDRNDLIIWSSLEKIAKCPEYEFLINNGPTQALQCCFPLCWPVYLPPRVLLR